SGSLEISWKIKDDMLTLTWREYVVKGRRRNVRRRGFGTEIIERMVGGTLDAEISRVFHRDGLECVFRIPVDRLVPDSLKNPSPTGEDD
ncbi:MAG: histidine kinase, partial [Nitratireductor sp.]